MLRVCPAHLYGMRVQASHARPCHSTLAKGAHARPCSRPFAPAHNILPRPQCMYSSQPNTLFMCVSRGAALSARCQAASATSCIPQARQAYSTPPTQSPHASSTRSAPLPLHRCSNRPCARTPHLPRPLIPVHTVVPHPLPYRRQLPRRLCRLLLLLLPAAVQRPERGSLRLRLPARRREPYSSWPICSRQGRYGWALVHPGPRLSGQRGRRCQGGGTGGYSCRCGRWPGFEGLVVEALVEASWGRGGVARGTEGAVQLPAKRVRSAKGRYAWTPDGEKGPR